MKPSGACEEAFMSNFGNTTTGDKLTPLYDSRPTTGARHDYVFISIGDRPDLQRRLVINKGLKNHLKM